MKGWFVYPSCSELQTIAAYSSIYHFNRLAKHLVFDKPEASDEAKVPNIE